MTPAAMLREVRLYDHEGLPVTDAATLAASRVLLVAECAARYLRQLEALDWPDEAEIQRLTNALAINLIRAADGEGKRLMDDVRAAALELGFELLPVDARKAGRMDS